MTSAARFAWFAALGLLLGAIAAALPAQQGPPLGAPQVKALEALAGRITATADQLAGLPAGDEERRALLEAELRRLRWQFGGLAARFDVQQFEAPQANDFDLQAKVLELLRPVIDALEDLTAESRRLTAMKQRAAALAERQQLAEDAQHAAAATLAQLPADSPARAAAEWEVQQRWKPTIERLRGERVVLEGQIDAKEQHKKSMLEAVRDGARGFLDNSGLNLLLAAAAFCAVFFGLRWIQGSLLRRHVTGRATSLRVLEVALAALSLLLAVVAALIVPYARDDWLLLPICLVALLGVGWVLIKMLPQFFEQIRLVLNLGPVREGERLLLDGLPWRIDTLRFYSRLSNPDLQGGVLRIPIQELVGRRSRRGGDDEPWFPSRPGDWVILADGVFGQVTVQTPETVVVADIGAARSYPTAAYLAQHPRNLSRGFGVRTSLGVDYRHQREATTAIPAALTEALRAGLERLLPPAQVRFVRVEFQVAGPSSLVLDARADFAGEAAPRWRELGRALQRILVDACTQHGWHLPFPQLTVHGPAAE